MATEKQNIRKLRGAQATREADLAHVGGTTSGTSPLTAVPGSAVAQDSARPLSGGAAAPRAADNESVRDDAGVSSTMARLRVPNWFKVLWSNTKARVGLFMLAGFVLIAVLAPLLAPYDPR